MASGGNEQSSGPTRWCVPCAGALLRVLLKSGIPVVLYELLAFHRLRSATELVDGMVGDGQAFK